MSTTNQTATESPSGRTPCSAARPQTVYGTEIEKQPDQLIEEIRDGLAHLRGQLGDIRRAYGWDDRIEQHEGALTVLICALSYASEELRAFRLKNGDLKSRQK